MGELTLGIEGAAVKPPFGATRRFVAGARVPKEAWPRWTMEGRSVVAMWALNPFNARSTKPISVTVANELGLAAGAAVVLSVLDVENGRPTPPIPGAVSPDAKTIAFERGIDRLTWILLAR